MIVMMMMMVLMLTLESVWRRMWMKQIDETRVQIDSKTVPRTFESYLRRTVPISVVVECVRVIFYTNPTIKFNKRTYRTSLFP